MKLPKALVWSVGVMVGLLIASMLVGQLLGVPILISYAESESMSPTIEEGDGFVLIPSPMMGTVESGDIILFEAQELHSGGLVTHRVAAVEDGVLYTQGDANPSLDQDGTEPPVQKTQVVGEVVQIQGQVVVIPHLGTVAEKITNNLEQIQRSFATLLGTDRVLGDHGLAYLILIVCIIGYILSGRSKRTRTFSRRPKSRDMGSNPRLIAISLVAVMLLIATMTMVAPTGSYEFEVMSASYDSEHPEIMQQGETETHTYQIPNNGLIPLFVYVEPASNELAVEPTRSFVQPQSNTNVSVTITAPEESGRHQLALMERRYLPILPAVTIDTLYRIHPWLPLGAINLVIAIPWYLIIMRVLGTSRIRERRARPKPAVRLRLRKFITARARKSRDR